MSMTTNDYINYWKTAAARDWSAVQALFASENYLQALFFAHLVIEKLLKAHWIKDNGGGLPPRVHNLEFLLSQTTLSMSAEDIDELRIMNAWNMEGRYQDYRDMIYRTTTQLYTQDKLRIVDKIRIWLLNQLP
ncbi:MAG: HEPN domain-containing protein [Bacteroidia bacterium]|nr:HEPN domain-containing protein [Bacteroidia bacterium]